jgi:phage baseplate assembly protein W
MATISFKSVGQAQETVRKEIVPSTPIPIGIKTPLRLSDKLGLLEMNHSLEDQIADNFRNLLQTNWGERVGLYNFGANLRPLMTEFVSQEDFDFAAVERIRNAVATWMPFIDLIDFSSETDRIENQSTGVIKITITYNIPSLRVVDKKIQTVLYVM